MANLWGTREAAAYLGIPVNTLYQWRSRGYGPQGRRVGKYVKFDPEDVAAWFKKQRSA